jgi:hypothetical protein
VPEALDVEQAALRKQIQDLFDAGQKASLHDDWLSRMQVALNSGISMEQQN